MIQREERQSRGAVGLGTSSRDEFSAYKERRGMTLPPQSLHISGNGGNDGRLVWRNHLLLMSTNIKKLVSLQGTLLHLQFCVIYLFPRHGKIFISIDEIHFCHKF